MTGINDDDDANNTIHHHHDTRNKISTVRVVSV